MASYLSHLVLLLAWTTAGVDFAVALWARSRWFAQRILVPEAVIIRADVAQRILDS